MTKPVSKRLKKRIVEWQKARRVLNKRERRKIKDVLPKLVSIAEMEPGNETIADLLDARIPWGLR